MRVKKAKTKHQSHKKIIKAAKGYRWGRSKIFSLAKNATIKAAQHAYKGRKNKKRDFRKLWIVRLSAALALLGKNYSRFQNGLKKKSINLNRKILADIAVKNPDIFKKIVEKVSA